jgi:hypothetical protein
MLLHVSATVRSIIPVVYQSLHGHIVFQGFVTRLGNVMDVLLSLRTRAQLSQVSRPSCADIDPRLRIGSDQGPVVVRAAMNRVKDVILLCVFISLGSRIRENAVQFSENVLPLALRQASGSGKDKSTHRFAPTSPNVWAPSNSSRAVWERKIFLVACLARLRSVGVLPFQHDGKTPAVFQRRHVWSIVKKFFFPQIRNNGIAVAMAVRG